MADEYFVKLHSDSFPQNKNLKFNMSNDETIFNRKINILNTLFRQQLEKITIKYLKNIAS